jgi:hypothetical protein
MGYEDDRRDRPMTGSWRPNEPSAFESLRLRDNVSAVRAEARELILTEALMIGRAQPGRWTSYSRRKEFYSRLRRYRPPCLTYSTVLPCIDELVALGLIEHDQAYPGRWGRQSRFRATEALLGTIGGGPGLVHAPREAILLRGEKGDLLDYIDTEQTRRWRRNIQEINEAIRGTEIKFDGRVIRDGDQVELDAVRIVAARHDMHRVFNRGSFALGGRFYGPWYQLLSSERRAGVTLNGEATVELDYPAIHAGLLYAEAGSLLDGDPYLLEGWPRESGKLAFNIAINAKDARSAVKALAQALGGRTADHQQAKLLLPAIRAKHRAIDAAFGTCAGLRFMRIDSDIAERVMLTMIRRYGAPVLGIHDSFVVPERHKAHLEEIMDISMRDAKAALAPRERFHNNGRGRQPGPACLVFSQSTSAHPRKGSAKLSARTRVGPVGASPVRRRANPGGRCHGKVGASPRPPRRRVG